MPLAFRTLRKPGVVLGQGGQPSGVPSSSQQVAVVSFSLERFGHQGSFEAFASELGSCSVICEAWIRVGADWNDAQMLHVLKGYASERNLRGISYAELLTSPHERYLGCVLSLLAHLDTGAAPLAAQPDWRQLRVSLSRDRLGSVTASVSVGAGVSVYQRLSGRSSTASQSARRARTRASLTWKF
jgi:hypothetical protein